MYYCFPISSLECALIKQSCTGFPRMIDECVVCWVCVHEERFYSLEEEFFIASYFVVLFHFPLFSILQPQRFGSNEYQCWKVWSWRPFQTVFLDFLSHLFALTTVWKNEKRVLFEKENLCAFVKIISSFKYPT